MDFIILLIGILINIPIAKKIEKEIGLCDYHIALIPIVAMSWFGTIALLIDLLLLKLGLFRD